MASQTELRTFKLPGAAGTAPPGQAPTQGKRLLFIDNLRLLLICGVLVNHFGRRHSPILMEAVF